MRGSGPRGLDPAKGPGVTVEDLGSSNISGAEVEDKRVTRMIPEGTGYRTEQGKPTYLPLAPFPSEPLSPAPIPLPNR